MPNGFLRENLKKKCLEQKSKHRHQLLHIQNRLGFKFQLKLTIFGPNLPKKGISGLVKQKNRAPPLNSAY